MRIEVQDKDYNALKTCCMIYFIFIGVTKTKSIHSPKYFSCVS